MDCPPPKPVTILIDGGAQPGLVLDTLDARCDHDTDTTLGIAADVGVDPHSIHRWLHPTPTATTISISAALAADDESALLAALPPAGPSVELDPAQPLDTLTELVPTDSEPVHR